jgi:hypothetical protein
LNLTSPNNPKSRRTTEVAEVVAEQPEVVAEQPEVNTDDIRVNIDKPQLIRRILK